MTVNNRSAVDKFINDSNEIEFISSDIVRQEHRITKIKFIFKNTNAEGSISFIR